jgi:diguanylate cyclase (GGDEF)-like protein
VRGLSRTRGRGGIAWAGALVLALGLFSAAIATSVGQHAREQEDLNRSLSNEARRQSEALDHYFTRARSLTQLTANNPAFREFYEVPGDRRAKILNEGLSVRDANSALAYLEQLFPGSIGEACFIDRGGAENARAVRGRVAPISELSPDERTTPFFAPTFALKPGQVYQARPYVSPDTHDWVVSNSTPVAVRNGSKPAIVHFEISLESFRRQAVDRSGRFDVAVVEARSGRVIVDSRYRQPAGDESRLGRPFDNRFARLTSVAGQASDEGAMPFAGTPGAFRTVASSPHNANHWVVVALAKHPHGTWIHDVGLLQLIMVGLALLLSGYAISRLRSWHARLQTAVATDALTGLGNRRKLIDDLVALVDPPGAKRRFLLAIFDLDGFKSYNDTFGHPAGDALLVRLSESLRQSLEDIGTPYRLGGDEFCILAPLDSGDSEMAVAAAERALTEHGEGFTVTCSYGSVQLPDETSDVSEALRIADLRMYARKSVGRSSAGRQTTDVLMKVLAERYPDIGDHLDGVTELASLVGQELELSPHELATMLQAASLHDIGKLAIPEAILTKPGALDEDEWEFIRQHTVIGERILSVAPSLAAAARLVRANHERFDGDGYPDGLSGDQIPLGARIICVCDAFDAMTSSRPYRITPLSVEGALAELRGGAGSQFDPRVVEAVCRVVGDSRSPARPASAASERLSWSRSAPAGPQ